MATKKASRSAKQAPKGGERDPLPREMSAALAQATSQDTAGVCEKLDEAANNLIRRACSQKQFEVTSGNCRTERCQTVEQPKIEPCIRVRWGDGPQDHLETDDTEVLCITVCNPYSNVVMKNFTLHLILLPAGGGPIPNQADGTPSVVIKPNFMICFDDIPACDTQKPGQLSCVSREVVLISRGAIPGKYRIFAIYCFEACFTMLGVDRESLVIELVAS
ncbi:MAG TPA: hypothetical protein VM095_21515 [Pyrinomonadaceae bacterium]|nr:hypothetical protein [Pyrinomonadaceae bacterium]